MRLFKKFTQNTNESVMDSLYQWMFNHININGITLDVDSTVMIAYNLMSLLRHVLLKTSTTKHASNTIWHTLQTLRYKLFAKPAYITNESKKTDPQYGRGNAAANVNTRTLGRFKSL